MSGWELEVDRQRLLDLPAQQYGELFRQVALWGVRTWCDRVEPELVTFAGSGPLGLAPTAILELAHRKPITMPEAQR